MSMSMLVALLSIWILHCLSFLHFLSLLSLAWLMLLVIAMITLLGVLRTTPMPRCRFVLRLLGLAFVILLSGCSAMQTWLLVSGRRTGHGDARPLLVALVVPRWRVHLCDVVVQGCASLLPMPLRRIRRAEQLSLGTRLGSGVVPTSWNAATFSGS